MRRRRIRKTLRLFKLNLPRLSSKPPQSPRPKPKQPQLLPFLPKQPQLSQLSPLRPTRPRRPQLPQLLQSPLKQSRRKLPQSFSHHQIFQRVQHLEQLVLPAPKNIKMDFNKKLLFQSPKPLLLRNDELIECNTNF